MGPTTNTAQSLYDFSRNTDLDHIAVYGGKSLRITKLHQDGKSLQLLSQELTLPDWIWAVRWLHHSNPDSMCSNHGNMEDNHGDAPFPAHLAVAMAHNAVVLLNWINGCITKEVHCADKCILYSAHFIGHEWRHLVIAAGTVFNQVVLWSVAESENIVQSGAKVKQTRSQVRESMSNVEVTVSENTNESCPQVAKVMHRLTGHQGVIFSMTTHSQKHLLCSVSDDRSIRLWKVSSADTDLQLSDWLSSNWVSATFDLQHVLFGHTARVWRALLLDDWIISVGEDACCIQWSYQGQIHRKVKGHKGRSIWSVACSDDEKMLATGGGDSSIRMIHLNVDNTLGSNATCNSQNLHPCCDQKDFPRIVRLLAIDKIVVMTNEGRLKCYDSQTQQWCTLVRDARFQSYSILETVARHGLVAMGSIQGLIKLIAADGSTFTEQQVFDGKVLSLQWLESGGSQSLYLLATGPQGHLALLQITLPPSEYSVSCIGRFYLPPTKQHWVSAACILPCQPLLICGDRGGTVHVYKMEDNQECSEAAPPVQSYPRIHSKAGVTDVCYHDNQVYSCGRDGHYRTYEVNAQGIHLMQTNRIVKGWDWIARLVQDEDKLYIMGFHMDQFIVYNLGQSEHLVSVPCGGGHRAWDFVMNSHSQDGATSHSTGGNKGRFVYIKNREVVVCDVALTDSSTVIKPSLHGRGINDSRKLFSWCGGDKQGHKEGLTGSVLATAGEDGLVNLVQWNTTDASSGELQLLFRLQGHISSVRALAISRSSKGHKCTNTDSVVLLSGGGRAQLMAWRIWLQRKDLMSQNINKIASDHREASSSCHLSHEYITETNKKAELGQNTSWQYVKETQSVGASSDNVNVVNSDHVIESDHVVDPDHVIDFDHVTESDHVIDPNHLIDSDHVIRDRCWSEQLANHSVIQDGGLRRRKTWKSREIVADSETRIMALDAFTAQEIHPDFPDDIHVVVAGCSDAMLRILLFDEGSSTFQYIAQSSFHQHCILRTTHITMATANHRTLILSAGTDGRVALWDISEVLHRCVKHGTRDSHSHSDQHLSNNSQGYHGDCVLEVDKNNLGDEPDDLEDGSACPRDPVDLGEPLWSHQCHQSGVNAIDVKMITGSQCMLVSGGDDNAIHTMIIDLSLTTMEEVKVQVIAANSKKDAHAAQVTGLSILDDSHIMSVSIDQRVTMWQVNMEDLQLILKSSMVADVADVSQLSVWSNAVRRQYSAVVCGVGLQGFSAHIA